ncbi:MAG: amidohydrolase family protein [Roseibium sp.]|uniref:amidohydrolase family protein n=1 Tax=Roseibium sp. TaxID=1936156 RepID=UPI003D9C1FDB
MMLIKNATLYAPEYRGLADILVVGEQVVQVSAPGGSSALPNTKEIDARGRAVCPGFIDNHVHVLGGGGGLGFRSRVPELQTSQLTRVGTTTVIGMLGYDQSTKDMRGLLGKTKGFIGDGISAFALTGATLRHPVPTLTGDLCDDIAFIDSIIGVGEISISELGYGYDSLGPGAQYIAETLVQALLVGRLAGKGGILCLQVPPYFEQCLKPLFEMLDKSHMPIEQMVPSHVNQTDGYMADAITWGNRGGWVDVGANYRPDNHYARSTQPAEAVTQLIEAGVPLQKILISSDGNGAPPKEEKGEAVPTRANYGHVGSLHMVWRQLIEQDRLKPEEALTLVTSNVATAYHLKNKGRVDVGMDADLVFFDENWNVDTVVARGKVMVEDRNIVVRGMFETTILEGLK